MCGLKAYVNMNENIYDSLRSVGGIPLPDDSTTDALKYLSVSLNFMDTWLKVF